jgi:uncharacterized protein
MFFHLILTDECNLWCRYCRGRAFDSLPGVGGACAIDASLPSELSYDLGELYSFLAQDPSACITFYGGEPLIRADLVREIMDHAPVSRFMVQTNGLLLDSVGQDYLNRMETILVSLDGPETLTDQNRGTGTYRKVISQVQTLVRGGYRGELIARMTVTDMTEIRSAVRYLANNDDIPFPSIHWQLDADFSTDPEMRNFSSWLTRSYNPGIRQLVRDWVGIMEREGRVPRWYPFLQTTEDLLQNRSSPLRCGAGYANYTIMTDGHIGPCPAMIGMRDYYVGHIRTGNPLSLPTVRGSCSCEGCPISGFCGGRCLYADTLRPWPPEKRALICGAVRNLHDALTRALPGIRCLIRTGRIALEDFSHTRYNGCEIIP